MATRFIQGRIMHGLTFHPACLLFPPMSQEELRELAADIKERGLLNPIVLIKNQVLDGRNRLAACELAGVEPRFVQWDGKGSPTEWVISQNLFRRHLTSSQRAVVAYHTLPLLEKEAKQRQRQSPGRGKKLGKKAGQKLPTFSGNGTNGKASVIAAHLAKTNENYVKAVKSISSTAPELVESIFAGQLKVPDAVLVARCPKAIRKIVLEMAQSASVRKTMKRIIREAEFQSLQASARIQRPRQSFRRGRIQVWSTDCLVAMAENMAPKSVSVVVTSPPFNLGVRYNSHNDNLPWENYREWLEKVFAEIQRVMWDDGSFFLNVGSSRRKPWNAMRIAEVAARYFVLQNEIVWVKAITVEGATHGHFSPVVGNRFLNHSFEMIFHFTKDGKRPLDRLAVGVKYIDPKNQVRSKTHQNLRCGGDVWFIPYETIQGEMEKGCHPAIFPVELAKRCIELAGIRKDTVVLDPFCGIGSTLLAARNLGVTGIGIDIDPVYCEQARRRLEE